MGEIGGASARGRGKGESCMDLHVVVMVLRVLPLSFLELTKEFLMIYERCPSRLQKKITEPMKSQVKEKK